MKLTVSSFPKVIRKQSLIDAIIPLSIIGMSFAQRTSDKLSFLNNFQTTFFVGLSCLFFLAFLKHSPKMKYHKHSYLLYCFLLLLCISAFWSLDPTHTIKHFTWLLFTTLFGYFIAINYTLTKSLHLILIGLSIVLIISLILVVVFPNKAIHTGELHFGAWKGLYFHKAGLGREASIAAILFLFTTKKPFNLLLFFISILIVYKTQSTIAGVTLFGVLIYFLVTSILNPIKQFKKYKAQILVLSLISCLSLVILNIEPIIGALSKDNTFNSRILIWTHSIDGILKNPALGYGFDSFWLNDKLSNTLTWEVPHAHNHFIDTVLDVGFFGLFLFGLMIVNYFRKLNKLKPFISRSKFDALFCLMSAILVISSTEEVIHTPFNLIWILFVVILLNSENLKTINKNL
ncbi:MAG: O-antigen ligase family protein [Reichenbachiella sp.]